MKQSPRELRDFSGVEESSRHYFGWRVVAALFVVAVAAWGFGFYGHAVYLAELQRLHGWSSTLISTASTLYYLVSAILLVYVNDVVRRAGAQGCILFGAGCFAIALAALSQISAPWQLFAAYLIMALGWTTMTVGAITNILGPWFDRKRGLAISLALNGASVGGIVVIPGLILLIGSAGFSATMLMASGLVLAVIVPLAFFVLGKPAPKPATLTEGEVPQIAWTRGAALKSSAFWIVSGPFCAGLLSQAAFLVHQVAFLETSIGRASAGIAVAITAAMSVAGRLAMGTLAERLNLRVFSAVSFGTQALALVAMTQTASVWPLFAFCAIYGLSVGNVITLPSLLIQREFPAASFGVLVALSTAIGQFIYSFGPGLLGVIRDASTTYGPGLWCCAALNLGAAVVLLLRRPG